jgi:hypothetical protein
MHACMHACIQFSLTKRLQSADRTAALPLAALAECAAASAVAPTMQPAPMPSSCHAVAIARSAALQLCLLLVHRCHICARTGPTPCHICAGTGPTPCHFCTGTGLTPVLPHLHRTSRTAPHAAGGRWPPGGRNRGPTCHGAWAPHGALCGACHMSAAAACRGGQPRRARF